MSHIFENHNQMMIRFPQDIADKLNAYFDQVEANPDTTMVPPSIKISIDNSRKEQCQSGVGLIVSVDNQKKPATVMQMPTIISTFKTLDRVNCFKSNDISEMIIVHQDRDFNIRQDQAQQVKDPKTGKIQKFKMRSGLTGPTRNIRQRNFRMMPQIDHNLVQQVDAQMEEIRQEITSQNKSEQNPVLHKQNRLKKFKKASSLKKTA